VGFRGATLTPSASTTNSSCQAPLTLALVRGSVRPMQGLRWVAMIAPWLMLVACGGSASHSPGPDGDVSGKGDASATAPRGQGAASIHFNTSPMDLCHPGAHWANAPFVAAGGQLVSGIDQPRTKLLDGEDGGVVQCRVTQDGTGYDVEGTLSAPAKDAMGQTVLSTVIDLGTSITEDQSDASGRLDVVDDKTQAHYGATDCTFSVKPSAAGEQLGIAPGRIWGHVSCLHLSDPFDATGATCQADQGYFILENCEQ
jgi:hypothetical protein